MSSARQIMLGVVIVWFVVALQSGCALAPASEISPQTGRVLDETTQQPIEGAIVVLRWQGIGNKTFVDTQTVCYHVESAVTDAEGRYATPSWKEESRYRDLSRKQILQTVYKPGYRYARMDTASGTQYLKWDVGSVKERLDYLVSLIRSGGCHASGKSQRNIYQLREAIYYEAKNLSASKNDLQWIREMAASVWLALDPSMSQHAADKAEAEFLKEHLQ